jgi:hypothetical protein
VTQASPGVRSDGRVDYHNRFKMTVSTSLFNGAELPRRQPLIRDSARESQPSAADHFGLQAGSIYRISYAVGGPQQRRVTRSVAVYCGQSERRVWNGEVVPCLDFALPQGRPLSLLTAQLVDARPAEQNERGQWVLRQSAGRRRRAARRHLGSYA